MSDPGKAVFLSYASQDAEAAKRICEALRATGVEVWFDQNELVGGDAWDQKIRKQIGSCALFVPIISASTQARAEGYFRLEWKLADRRTDLIGKSKAFLLPVCIDDTRDSEADVPDSFLAVQWTRLNRDEAIPAFAARVQKLLEGGPSSRAAGANTPTPASPGSNPARDNRSGRPRWLAPLLGGVVIAAVALAILRPWEKPAAAPVQAATPTNSTPATTQPTAKQLVAQAWEAMLSAPEPFRAELEIAGDYCRRASELDPMDAEIWATWSQVETWYLVHQLDASPARRESARAKAARALRLAPNSYETLLAQACFLVRGEGFNSTSAFASEAESLLQQLLKEKPDEPRALLALGLLYRNLKRYDEGNTQFDRLAAAHPAWRAAAYNGKGWLLYSARRFDEAVRAAALSVDARPFFGNVMLQVRLATQWLGDLDLALAALERLPMTDREEDGGIVTAVEVYWYRREPAQMLRLLNAVPRDWLDAGGVINSKGWLLGRAHEMAGNGAAARMAWQKALQLVDARLAANPGSAALLRLKGQLLEKLGERAAAEEAFVLVKQMGSWVPADFDWAALQTVNWASLRYNPEFDDRRADPRFQTLLAEAEKDPRRCPHARSGAPALSSAGPDDKSVAVLAFANLSDDKGNEYFSDGISEELLNVLAKVPGLTVKGRSSGFFFKGKDTPSPEIAKQLGVAYIVQGSVRKAGNRVRISAQLIRAATDEVVWSSGSLDRELQDIFAVQDEIAGLVAQQLQLKLGTTGVARVVNPEAHRLLLEARYYWHQRGEQNFDRTEALLHRALAIDPDFAPAHAALADLWVMRAAYRSMEGVSDLSEELRALRTSAARATELDPSIVSPIAAMAYGLLIEGRMGAAQQHFETAVARSPNDPTVRFWRALFLMENGEFDAAYREFADARELDPKAWIITHLSGQNAMQLGRREEALALFRRANADRADGFAPAVGYESLALWHTTRSDEAVVAARAVRQSWPRQPRWHADAHALWVLRQAGLTTEAAAYAEALFAGLPAHSYQRGFVLAALGRFDEALPYLERTNTLSLDAFAWLEIFTPWRDDPRFAALIEKLHWSEQYARAREAMKHAAAEAKP